MKASLNIATAALLLSLPVSRAQETEPSPTPQPGPSASAYLRTWVMLPAEVPPAIVGNEPKLADNLTLDYVDDAGVSQVIASNLSPFSTSGYAEFTPGVRKMRLLRVRGTALTELAGAKLDLKPGAFLTAVIEKVNGAYRLSLLDDTPKPPKESEPGVPPPPPVKEIIFYNFLAGSTLNVSSRDARFSRAVPYGQPQLVSNLPGKIFNVQMPMKSKRREFLGEVEVDLQANNRLSFVMVQDIYGRQTARVLTNGKLD